MNEATKTSPLKEQRLIDHILEEFGMLDPDELDKLIMSTARRFVDDPLAPVKSMTEEGVRAKFGDVFESAYELLDNNDKHDLIMMALQGYAESAKNFEAFLQEIKDLYDENCEHEQLYAHVTIDAIIPIKYDSPIATRHALDNINKVLDGTELNNYRVRAGIEVNDDNNFL